MSSILLVTSSPRGAASHSTRVATELAAKLRKANPSSTLVVRDLVANPLPHIDPDYSTGIYTPAEARTQRQAEVVAVSDAALDELFAADTVILATGFINFGISSTLKSWIDHISRSGKSFSYGENGPKGLVTGKKVYVVLASGGIYSEGAAVQMDHADPLSAQRAWLHGHDRRRGHPRRRRRHGAGGDRRRARQGHGPHRGAGHPAATSPSRPDKAAVQTKGRRRTAPAFLHSIPVLRGPRVS